MRQFEIDRRREGERESEKLPEKCKKIKKKKKQQRRRRQKRAVFIFFNKSININLKPNLAYNIVLKAPVFWFTLSGFLV